MRVAAIDIGTNTILMLIAELHQDGTISPIRDEHAIARMGKGVDEHGVISRETFDRVLSFLRQFKEIADSYHPDKIVACGTSALRDAANAKEFIDFIDKRTGLRIEVLDWHDEAELTYLGAVSEYLPEGEPNPFAVLDIGGGSTELTVGQGRNLAGRESLNLGAVRLTERILKSSPPTRIARRMALEEIRSQLSKLPPPPPQARLLGVAGTVTTMAAIDLNLTTYDPHRVGGHFLGLGTLTNVSEALEEMTAEGIMTAFPQIQAGRADIIYAGTLILTECLKRFGLDGITASDRGVRYGIALRECLPKARKS